MLFQKIKSLAVKPIFKFKVNYSYLNPIKWNWQKIKEFLKVFLLATGLILVFMLIYDEITYSYEDLAIDVSDEIIAYLDENNLNGDQSQDYTCNVAGIELHGNVVTYISPDHYDSEGNLIFDESASDLITGRIRTLEEDDSIKAILLEVDSYGGSGVAGEEIAAALKNTKKPTVALIRDAGASAAYWAASGADKIYASKNSDVGSIGVTYSYLDNIGKNRKDGLTYNQLSSGKFKDTGDPDKPLTLEEKNLIMRDVKIMHQNFIKAVSENRNIGIEKVANLADGSTMLGEAALRNGLIDQIGGMPEVKEYLKEQIGEDVVFCW